jgi:uncharacterized membrane protein YgcG
MFAENLVTRAATVVGAACIFALSSPANAYHFFEADKGGCKFANTGPGNLDFIIDKSSTDAIGDALLADFTSVKNAWNGVSTAKDVIGNLTKSAGNFTRANFADTWGKGFEVGGAADGRYEVVLDEDGEILELFGLEPDSIFGFGPSQKDTSGGGCVTTDALVLINGSPSVPTSGDALATSIHEVGHILGLAHSSVAQYNDRNNRAFSGGTSSPSSALDVIALNDAPTMYPFALPDDTQGRTLEADDIAGISQLYPEPSFALTLGTIEGTVNSCSDATDFLEGVNVRAVSTSDRSVQLTRYTKFDGPSDKYVIRGIPPGNYRVIVEAMGFNGHTKSRMAIETNLDQGFPTEYFGPTAEEEANCEEETPSGALPVAVAAGSTETVNIRVEDDIDLALVVDDTGSMSSEISAVRDALLGMVTILESLEVSFPKVSIITFKDTVTQRVVSDDPDVLRGVIEGLRATGGGDCPESSNAGIFEGGQVVKRGGRVIMFTDADSRPDGPSRDTVSAYLRERGVRLSVLLSATCSSSFPSASVDHGRDLPISDTLLDDVLLALQGEPETTPDPDALSTASVALSSGGSSARRFEEPAPLGSERADDTNFALASDTGGIFLALARPRSGDDRERYINVATSLAVSSVAPAVGTVTPLIGPQGATMDVVVAGSNTSWFTGSVLSFPGTGITIDSISIVSPTEIRATISIPPDEAPAFVDVRVVTPLGGGATETAESLGGFQVRAATGEPDVVSVVPAQGFLGQTLTASVRGLDLMFDDTTMVDFGAGITVDNITVVGPAELSVEITITEAAATGFRDVRVFDNVALNVTERRAFQVAELPPAIARISSLSEAVGIQGQRDLAVNILGVDTSFSEGVSTPDFGPGVTVKSIMVNSPTSIDTVLDIAPDGALTPRDVTVSTGDEVAVILNGFRLVPIPVTITGGVLTTQTGLSGDSIADMTNRPEDIRYLVGLEISVPNPGDSVSVAFSLPNVAGDSFTWWKYLSDIGWIDYSDNVSFSADRKTLTMTLIDGGLGDDDGEVNGVIIDPSGLALAPEGSSSSSSSGSSSGSSGGSGSGSSSGGSSSGSPDGLINGGSATVSGGGGGCVYNPSGRMDPMLPLLALLSAVWLMRRKRVVAR